MNILLLGGSGLLGGYFQKILKKKNLLFSSPSHSELDITSPESIEGFNKKKNLRNFSHILFCAAYTDVDGAESQNTACENINVKGLENMLEYKIPLIHFSTDYVFGEFPKDIEITEDFPRFPLNYYGGTKLRAEKLLESSEIPYWNIRTSWLFGGKNCFVEKILRKSTDISEISIVDDEIGRPTFAKDLAKYVVENFLENSQNAGSYHVQNTGDSVSWAGFADFFLRKNAWNGVLKKIPGISLDRPADRPQNSVLKNTKLLNELRPWCEAIVDFLEQKTF